MPHLCPPFRLVVQVPLSFLSPAVACLFAYIRLFSLHLQPFVVHLTICRVSFVTTLDNSLSWFNLPLREGFRNVQSPLVRSTRSRTRTGFCVNVMYTQNPCDSPGVDRRAGSSTSVRRARVLDVPKTHGARRIEKKITKKRGNTERARIFFQSGEERIGARRGRG